MSDESDQVNLTVQRFAVLTCIVALLPISVGALVTTLKAGMAFADWPTSDGHNMLLYPWLNDLRHTDKFVEHGHRLAGVLIGIFSILLVAVTFAKEKRTWVRAGSVTILCAVIAQGLLGGMRVRMNAQTLAMIHSITGGLFFTLCFLFAIAVRSTGTTVSGSDRRISAGAFAAGCLLPAAVFGQYVLGGMFRHLGRMLHEHLAGAAIVTILVISLLAVLLRSDLAVIRRRGRWLGFALLIQVSLGLGAWVTKLGLPYLGWVAHLNSPAQSITCSLHTVGGMLLLATASATAMELVKRARAGQLEAVSVLFRGSDLEVTRGLSTETSAATGGRLT